METTLCTNTFITKFDLTDRYIYIKFHWKPNDIDLFHAKVFDNDSVWSGIFSNECVTKNCERIDEDNEEVYCSTVLNVLKCTSQEFIYVFPTVTSDTTKSKFSWKRKFEKDVLLHGSFTVERCKETMSKDSLIDLLLLQNNELNIKIEQHQRSTEKLHENLNQYKNELIKFTNIKSTIETNLYGKFVKLLNEKKERIQLLEKHIQNIKGTEDMCVDDYLV